MFSQTDSVLGNESHIKTIYQRFQDAIVGANSKNTEKISQELTNPSSNEVFSTPISSSGNLMELSPRQNIENYEYEDLLTGPDLDTTCDVTTQEGYPYEDMLNDPGALDFLMKCSNTQNQTAIDHGKESLYVKFDPLFNQRNKQSLKPEKYDLVNSSDCDGGYETESVVSSNVDHTFATPKRTLSAGPTLMNAFSKEKPTQVVPPAVHYGHCSTPSNNAPVLVRSLSAIMAPHRVATDRLINIPGSTPPVYASHLSQGSSYDQYNIDRLHSLKVIIEKLEHETRHLKDENSSLKYNMRELEEKLKKTSDENTKLIEKEERLLQQVNDKARSNKQMIIVVEEYEKTISSTIADHQKDKLEFKELAERLIQEKDQALTHLSSMEASFNDLLSKYERCKSLVIEYKDRDEENKRRIADYEANLDKFNQLYVTLKEATAEKLSQANEMLENMKKNHENEVTKLNATIKKQEVQVSSLEESLQQKTRDNEKLVALCDELITKVN